MNPNDIIDAVTGDVIKKARELLTPQQPVPSSATEPVPQPPVSASVEWAAKYGSLANTLRAGMDPNAPDTESPNLALTQTRAFHVINGGLAAGQSVAEIEATLTLYGYVPSVGAPFGWAYVGFGGEPQGPAR